MAQSLAAEKPRRGFKEFVRKFFVSLKRSPHNIAMVMMLVTYVFYSFNLTNISNTTALINLSGMGLCEFISMLFGILAFVAFLRSFPRREKPNLVMIAITVVMLAGITIAEFFYTNRILASLNDPVHPYPLRDSRGDLTEEGGYILTAQSVVNAHIVLLIICIALIVLLPIYSKLIKQINTSIDVAGNENMKALDMASDE